MNNELLLLTNKPTDTLIEQTETKPLEMLEIKMNKQMETFSFSPPINFFEEVKWLLGVTSFETTNSVFDRTNENSSFSIRISSYWSSEGGEELINKLNKLLQLSYRITCRRT